MNNDKNEQNHENKTGKNKLKKYIIKIKGKKLEPICLKEEKKKKEK